MPLIKSKSKQAFSHNVGAEMSAGKPQKQALAIAYATKRRARKGMSEGGMVDEREEPMDQDDKFLSAEADETPFHSESYDDGEASGLFEEKPYDMEEGNADQDEARAGVMERIMRKIRMRHMGR